MPLVRGVEHELALRENRRRSAMMNHRWRQQSDPALVVLIVVPREEVVEEPQSVGERSEARPLCYVVAQRTTEVLRLSLRTIDPSVVASVKRKVVLGEEGDAARYRRRGFDTIEICGSR